MTILITGGTDFIGSHAVVALSQAGFDVVILDNLSNSSAEVLPRLEDLIGKEIPFYKGDIRDRNLLQNIFSNHKIKSVMHFAGLKAVGESVSRPIHYYENNVSGSLILIEEMLKAVIYSIIFSSSATVYGTPTSTELTENMPTGGTTNPYGTSKYMVERILMDVQKAYPELSVVILRYFNPIGAHISGKIGESPNGIPNNLLPYVCQVAAGKLPYLSVFGNDYPTPDGTGVRDYIHVVDLVDGHLKAMVHKSNQAGVHIYNLGTGSGSSVLEIIEAFEQTTGKNVPYQIKPRRPGDIAACYANPTLAQKEIQWQTKYNLSEMIEDAWRWQVNNPNGYNT